MGADPAAAKPFFLRPLFAQLLLNGEPPAFFLFWLLQPATGPVHQFKSFRSATEVGLPPLGDRLKSLENPTAPAMNPGAHQCHLDVKGIQQGIAFRAGLMPLAPELGALSQQPAQASDQVCIDRFQLQDHPIQPLTPECRFAAHQLQIQGTEADAAQRPNQIQLPFKPLSVPAGLATTVPAKFKFEAVTVSNLGADEGFRCLPVNQISVLAAAVGSKAAKQFDRFEQIGLSDAVRPDHQELRLRQLQLKKRVVAEPLQLEPVKPDGCWDDLWLRYLYRGVSRSILLRLMPLVGM